jgi:hypothetical protein
VITWLAVLLLAGATFRLTRLVTADEITAGLRGRIRDRNRRQEQRIAGSPPDSPPLAVRYVRNPRRPVSWVLYRITSCAWCTSVYAAALVTLCYWEWTTPMIYVCAAATASAIAGLVSERS